MVEKPSDRNHASSHPAVFHLCALHFGKFHTRVLRLIFRIEHNCNEFINDSFLQLVSVCLAILQRSTLPGGHYHVAGSGCSSLLKVKTYAQRVLDGTIVKIALDVIVRLENHRWRTSRWRRYRRTSCYRTFYRCHRYPTGLTFYLRLPHRRGSAEIIIKPARR